MTDIDKKREEIRKDLARSLYEFTEFPKIFAWLDLPEEARWLFFNRADGLLYRFQETHGVVIKVDRELPENPYKCEHEWPCSACGVSEGQAMTIGAGYIATEPLIKDAT